MNWTDGRLTTREAERALRNAGINPDFSEWSSADLHRAAEVLDAAADLKRSGPEPKHTHAVYAVDRNDDGHVVCWEFISDYPNRTLAAREAKRLNKGRPQRLYEVAHFEHGFNMSRPVFS